MGYPTKVQLIKRKESEQWYINFPAAVAQAMEFERGETVEWTIEDKANLLLHRLKVPASTGEKNGCDKRRVGASLRPGPPGFWPGAHFCSGEDSGDERPGRVGASHHQRHALRQRPSVRGLVGCLSPL